MAFYIIYNLNTCTSAEITTLRRDGILLWCTFNVKRKRHGQCFGCACCYLLSNYTWECCSGTQTNRPILFHSRCWKPCVFKQWHWRVIWQLLCNPVLLRLSSGLMMRTIPHSAPWRRVWSSCLLFTCLQGTAEEPWRIFRICHILTHMCWVGLYTGWFIRHSSTTSSL